MKKLLIFLLLVVIISSYGYATVTVIEDFDEKTSLPVLNEELRKLDKTGQQYRDRIETLEAAISAPEGTAILSTGEGGGSKYLREDGDGTCSWQTPAGSGDIIEVGLCDTGACTDDFIDGTDIGDDVINSEHIAAGAVDDAHIAADTITHASIADADQTITISIYFEDPVATDDFKSIWANKTANDFIITGIWGESDQTVNFDLQVDDGTPADVSGTDISPAAGEAEDTSLEGDTTVAAGEELDLAITSVSGTPTWVSIAFTGHWVD